MPAAEPQDQLLGRQVTRISRLSGRPIKERLAGEGHRNGSVEGHSELDPELERRILAVSTLEVGVASARTPNPIGHLGLRQAPGAACLSCLTAQGQGDCLRFATTGNRGIRRPDPSHDDGIVISRPLLTIT
jgi:hypothetical protein